jgi:hypothetical protein
VKVRIGFLPLLLLLAFACQHENVTTPPNSSEPPVPIWRSLGFEDKPAWRLVIAEPYLYVCAGPKGLWRLNLEASTSAWEYVGLADTSLGRQTVLGVEDVVIHRSNPDWLLAIFVPEHANDYGIYRSFDGGKTWVLAGKGMEYIFDGYVLYFYPDRLLQYPNYILAAGDGAVFRTEDFGNSWSRIYGGERGRALLDINVFKFHSRFNHIVWMGGEGGFFAPYLAKSTDSGATWELLEIWRLVDETGVNSIVLSPDDANVVYVGMGKKIIKSVDGGKTWATIREPGSTAMLVDPRNSSHLWLAYGKQLSETWDAGSTWLPLSGDVPVTSGVLEMIWDEKRVVIYVGTLDGVYRYRP